MDGKERSTMKVQSRFLVLPASVAILTAVACSKDDEQEPCDVPLRVEADGSLDFTHFESGQVRPLALSNDGSRLYATNTPDGRLEVFNVDEQGIQHVDSVPVGLEPVAVAIRGNQAWVVNHLSDSVSIVDLELGRVIRTLLVGDEPRDIVFAGPDGSRAFVTTAHRGQNSRLDPELTTPGVGRADVWVFDVDAVEQSGGEPLTIINLFTDSPRALAVSPDGMIVYAAGFLSGNHTTVVPEEVVTLGGGLPEPNEDAEGEPQPPASLIVRHDGTHWVDELGRQWDDAIKFSLPDEDVFMIDASADVPIAREGEHAAVSAVGTVLYAMGVNPRTGVLYVTNTEAVNHVRFEGGGHGMGTVRGHTHETRLTVVGSDGEAQARHLNKHIDYDECCETSPNSTNERSLALPTSIVVSADGEKIYVGAFGSAKIGVFKSSELEDDSFIPDADDHIRLSGGGPSGMALDERHGRLYVLTRFDNSISIVDLEGNIEQGTVPMHNPEPVEIIAGRTFLYDASRSSHGETACGSCHVFGDLDGLAWDLGDPEGSKLTNPGPFRLTPAMVGMDESVDFRPLKGPMATQSLRGMANHGPMHWRGDRTGGNDEASAQPDAGSFDEIAAFLAFNSAFESLNGGAEALSSDDMLAFAEFALQLTYPPNPIRNLDDSLTPEQQAGRDFYFSRVSDRLFACNGCHVLDPLGNAELGVDKPGFFGTDGHYSFEFEPQTMKIPHFRNLYQKVGMFGMAETSKLLPDSEAGNEHYGDQIRGFGFLHDGSVDTIERFLTTVLFRFVEPAMGDPGNPGGFSPDEAIAAVERANVTSFLLAYDSNLKPIVGQQVTMSHESWSDGEPRLDLLLERAERGECDLVARGSASEGYLYVGLGVFVQNEAGRLVFEAWLRNQIEAGELGETTFTCMPPGSGWQAALDRDLDGYLDADELRSHSDPADPMSTPSCEE